MSRHDENDGLPLWIDLDAAVPADLRAKVPAIRAAALDLLRAAQRFDDAHGADLHTLRRVVWDSFSDIDLELQLPWQVERAIGLDGVFAVLGCVGWYVDDEKETADAERAYNADVVRETNAEHADLLEQLNSVRAGLDDDDETRTRLASMSPATFRAWRDTMRRLADAGVVS